MATSVLQQLATLRRWTPFFMAAPRRFLDVQREWGAFDIGWWSANDYEWEEDDWSGLVDISQPVEETLTTGTGDCVDYATVVLSYLSATTDRELSIHACYTKSRLPPKGHLIAFDGERTYSSGEIRRQTPEEYLAGSEYDVMFSRKVR